MDVAEAVSSRRSVRAFLDRPFDVAVLRRVLELAQRAPSGGNLQPWHAIVLAGEPLARLTAHVAASLPEGRAGWRQDYTIYPEKLGDPYETRRVAVGEAMYGALGIPRECKADRLKQFVANFRAFDAPALMLVHTPRYMGPPQWSDIGMWLQTVMLLLRGEGLDSCAQEAWALYHHRIRDVVELPQDHVLFCGMAIGHRNATAPVNGFEVARAPLSEAVRFEGFTQG